MNIAKRMKQFYQYNPKILNKRLIYEQINPKENLGQSLDRELGSLESIKEMKQELEKVIKPVSSEKESWQGQIALLRDQLKNNPAQKIIEGQFECLGKTVTVIVTANGADYPHETFVDGKPLAEGFISWALNTKKEQTEKTND